jgi:hypothetical protein
MITLGYDFYKQDKIESPNGLIGQKITDKNKDTSNIFQLYLPPYLTEMFKRFKIDFKIDSVDNIKKQNLKNKWIYVLDCIGDPRGWLGKYDEEDENSIKSLFSGVSETVINQVRKDKAVIMIYQPMEGYPTDWLGNDIYKIIYDEIVKFKLNPKNILYVTGNRKLESDFKKWKPKSKYSDLEDILVHSFNNERYLDFRNKWNIADLKSKKQRRKHFLCYNRTPRGHRLYLLALLHGKGLIPQGFVSCQKVQDNWLGGYLHNLGVGVNMRKSAVSHMREFKKGTPYIVDVDEWDTNHFDTSPVWPYEESFFSVTTNTLFEEKSVFLDEKVWKPILNYHPFIFVGCSGSLEELGRQGFKTFHPFIDESYDKEKHPVKRMMMISKEVERLCSYTLNEMENWYEQLIPRLKHNHTHLFNKKSFNQFVRVLNNACK